MYMDLKKNTVCRIDFMQKENHSVYYFFFNLKAKFKCLEFCVLLYKDKIIFKSKYVLNFSI